jgi:ATP-dependent DNA ligase
MNILKEKITNAKAVSMDFGVKDVIKYVEPKIVIEVKCMAKTEDGSLRFPAFLRVRTDKEPSECKVNQ